MSVARYTVRRPLLAQPRARLPIDWECSLTRGLLFSTYNAAEDYLLAPIDYVSGRQGSQNTAVASVVDARGRSPLFNGATSTAQFLGLNLAPHRRVTVTWWAYWDAYANNDKVAWAYADTDWQTNAGLVADPNGSSGRYALLCGSGGAATGDFPEYNRPSAAVWHFYAAQWDRNLFSAGRVFWIDAVRQTSTGGGSTFALNTPFGAYQSLRFLSAYSGSNNGAGRLANFNIWARHLTDTEIREMYINSFKILKPQPVDVFPVLAAGGGGGGSSAQHRWFLVQ